MHRAPLRFLSLPTSFLISKQFSSCAFHFTRKVQAKRLLAPAPTARDGTYNPGGDDPDEYSWFVTFIYKDAATDRQLRTMNICRHFNSVLIERIKDNGKQGVLIGVQ